MAASLVLIGPSKAGKTTLSILLGETLTLPVIELDALRWDYYAEIGYDPLKADELRRQGGMKVLIPYWKPFELHAVERVLGDYPENHVIAFGAGHSVYEDEIQFARVQALLANFPQVILIVPSPDIETSIQVLRQHLIEAEPSLPLEAVEGITEINRQFLIHPSNTRLATITVYNAGQSAVATCHEIVRLLNS